MQPVSICRTEGADFVREDFWLIVAPTMSDDETSKRAHTGRRSEDSPRHLQRATRRHHSAEEKIRIVLEGLRGEVSIADHSRKEGINQNLYYRWSKEFLETGKKRLAGLAAARPRAGLALAPRSGGESLVPDRAAVSSKQARRLGADHRPCRCRT
jgi:transposase-like protein